MLRFRVVYLFIYFFVPKKPIIFIVSLHADNEDMAIKICASEKCALCVVMLGEYKKKSQVDVASHLFLAKQKNYGTLLTDVNTVSERKTHTLK